MWKAVGYVGELLFGLGYGEILIVFILISNCKALIVALIVAMMS